MAKLNREIDFTKEVPCEIYNMGYLNEHNATVITVTAPKSLSIENGADLICIAIETGGAIVRSQLQEDRTIKFSLTRECTGCEYFNLQVEGYSTEKDADGKNKFVGRSKMIKGLHLLQSVQGEDGYEKAESVEEKIATALNDFVSKESFTETKEELTGNITAEATARTEGDASTLASAKAYTDEKTATIDLSAYAKTETVNTELAKKQDKLTAGNNITIANNTISSDVDLTAYAKSADLASYATQSYVQEAIYGAMGASY